MNRDPVALAARLRAAGCVWAEDEARLLLAETDHDDDDRLAALVDRRIAGEPLETVLGWTVFRGARIQLRPGVFVPRPRTSFLVEVALAHIADGDRVADVCCGSGALGVAVLAERPGVELVAGDVDPLAVEVARRNLPTATVVLSDLLTGFPSSLRGRLDVIVANVPYVPTAEIAMLPPEAREHEPRPTLDGGPDGTDVLRRLAGQAGGWLRPGGVLVSEIGASQVGEAQRILRDAGLAPGIRYSDEWETTALVGARD